MNHIRNRTALSWAFLIASAVVGQATATAQTTEYHQPLHERLPPGFTADTLARVRHYDPMWLQPVRVELPSEGVVSVYSATPQPLAMIAAPAQFSVSAGHLYRLRISDMPEFPGVEIFPSIEILDRLHPPHGAAANYPIPIVLTQADLRDAVAGALVTRVIYLENPRLAAAVDPLRRESPHTVDPTRNALQEADQMGRAMIIVRIGGRIPSDPNLPLSYYGSGGAFDPGESIPVNAGVVTLSDKPTAKKALASRGR
jgi:hypothetical protein